MLIKYLQFGDFFDTFQSFMVLGIVIFIFIVGIIVFIIYFVLKFFFGTTKKETLAAIDRFNPYRKRDTADIKKKFCEHCGQKIEENASNCPYCGARIN